MINSRRYNNDSTQVAAAVLKSSTMHPQMQAELVRSRVRDSEQEQPEFPYPDDHNNLKYYKALNSFCIVSQFSHPKTSQLYSVY